jgi:hypothetical protein
MWKSPRKQNDDVPSVLIVEGEGGAVFIVENKEEKPQVEKIVGLSFAEAKRKLLGGIGRSPKKKKAPKFEYVEEEAM